MLRASCAASGGLIEGGLGVWGLDLGFRVGV